jgi:hypothetical protein
MDLLVACILLAVAHVVLVYYLANVVGLEYRTLFIVLMAANAAIAAYVRIMFPSWKDEFFNTIKHAGSVTASSELLTILGVFIASGIASYYIIYKKYGGYGALFAFGGNMVVNTVV